MFDPIKSKHIPFQQQPIKSYWNSTEPLLATKALHSDIETDVAIVGAGYTGLNCALELAKSGVSDVTVLDANSIGWGCSGRNAGFVLPGTGRLSYKQLVDKYGKDKAIELHEGFIKATDDLSILAHSYDIDKTENGYLKLAHSKKWFDKLNESAHYLSTEFNYDVEAYSKEELDGTFVVHNKAYGGIRYKNGFGLNPAKLANVYANLCLERGIQLFSNTPVLSITKQNDKHVLITPTSKVTARKVVLASNGYTTKSLGKTLSGSILSVLTSVIVTRPLNKRELEESQFQTHQVMMDTRELKYYYRLLPDNRILFGGRSAISGSQASNPKYKLRLLEELKSSFVGLNNLTIDFDWNGWISVSLDQVPHIHGTQEGIYYSTGYCGSGVSYTAYAGKQLANLIVNGPSANMPFNSPLPKFPFPRFRRAGQAMYYQFGRLKDSLS
jgi:glycine/D-amino acid oxidase-like deaminating enzyme